MTTLLSTQAAEIIGTVLLHSLWQGVVVAALAWLALSFLQRPAARYRVACLALLALLLWPAVTGADLAWRGSGATAVAAAGELGAGVSAAAATAFADGANAAPLGTGGLTAASTPALDVADPVDLREAVAPSSLHGRLASVFAALWLLGVLVGLTRLVAGLALVAHLRRTAGTPAARLVGLTRDVARRLGVSARVRVRESTRLAAPVVVGVLRPALLLPAGLAASLPPAQLEAVLAHELAHVLRRDYLVNALQRLAETLLFHHPAAWWLSGVVRTEREHLCDDAAVRAVGGDARPLTQALLTLATRRGSAPLVTVGAADGDLVGRVRRLVGRSGRRPAATPAQAAGPALLLGLLALTGALLAQPVAEAQTAGAPLELPVAPFELRYGHYFDLDEEGAPQLFLQVDLQPGLMDSLAPATVRVLGADGEQLAEWDMTNYPLRMGPIPVELASAAAVEVTTELDSWTVPLAPHTAPTGFGPVSEVWVTDTEQGAMLEWDEVPGTATYRVGLFPAGAGPGPGMIAHSTEPLVPLTGLQAREYEVRIWAYTRDPSTPGFVLSMDASDSRLGTIRVPTSAPGAASSGAVEGTVVVGSRPAAGVAVHLYPDNTLPGPKPPARTTVTDAEGRYRFENVAPGAHHVSPAMRPPTGFGAPVRMDASTFVVAPGGTTHPTDLHLLQAFTLRGALASGTAAPGETVLEWEPMEGAASYVVKVLERVVPTKPWSASVVRASSRLTGTTWSIALEPATVYEVVLEAQDEEGVRIGQEILTLRTTPGS